MRLPTHIAFSTLFWFGVSSLFCWRPEGGPIGAAMIGAVLPEIDTPHSLIGSFTRPVSELLRERLGHRTLTHSLLGLFKFHWWLALITGFLSHLLLDMGTKSGVRLLWPRWGKCVFPGKDHLRLDTGAEWAGRVELSIFSILFIASVTLWPLASMGLLGTMRYALADIDQTYNQYRQLSAQYEVFLKGRFQDNISKELFEGSYPIVDIFGEGYVILQGGELRTVGKYGSYNLHPLRVHLVQGDSIKDITAQVDLSGRYIGELKDQIDLSKEHYLYGTLELEEPIDPPYYSDRWNPISGTSRVKLNLARWQDLVPYQDIKVKSGTVIIRQRLREGEELSSKEEERLAEGRFLDLPSSHLPSSFDLEPIPVTFEVATIDDLLIKVGDHLEVGDLIGRRSSERLIRQRMAVELARARYEAGLIDEAELRAAERELRLMEVEHEVRAKIGGTVTKIEIKSVKDQVAVVAYIRPEGLGERLGLTPAGSGSAGLGGEVSLHPESAPFSEGPSTTAAGGCPPPLQPSKKAFTRWSR
ncbi:MAG: metal-dependent hydrolase, partial [Candidatus Bipolaricaulia bacterium]